MSYLVLARKCRPKAFHEIVGQQHITQTLKNSILSGHIAHSFLFTGPRGVGKTTTARILAKALNCQHTNQGEPCNTCAVCQEITQGSFVDVLEIDGASNNSVDDIRDLREKIRYVPTAGRNKIYIVDEVHMLSGAAFNALLKTLEEPPAHAYFIFATTEPHKIPATILSRCQRFDFKRLHPKEIADALQKTAQAEGWKIPVSVFTLIARSADGSMRDAQSILDQVMSSSEGELQYDEVLYLLGLVRKDQIHAIWDAVFNGEPEDALTGLAEVLERGYDLRFFAEQLLNSLRDLIICKTCRNPASLLGISEEEVIPLKRQSDPVSLDDLQQYFHLLAQSLDRMKGSSHPQIILEMTLVQLARMERVASFAEILQRLAELQEALGRGSGGDAVQEARFSTMPSPSISRESAGANPPLEGYVSQGQPEAQPSPATYTPVPNTPASHTPAQPSPAPYKPAEHSPSSPPYSPATSPPRAAAPLSDDKPPFNYRGQEGEDSPAHDSPEPVAYAGPVVSVRPQSSLEHKWAAVQEGVRKEKPALFPVLQKATLNSVTGDTITLSFPKSFSFYLTRINEESSRSVVQKWCRDVFGAHYRLECCTSDAPGMDKGLSSGEKEDCTSSEIDDIIDKHPIIKTAMEIFSAQAVQSDVSFRRKD